MAQKSKPSTRYTVTLIAIFAVLLLGAMAILVAAFADPRTGLTALNLYLFLISGLVALVAVTWALLPEPAAALVTLLWLLFDVRRWLLKRPGQAAPLP